jgi:hypothetical protein
MRCCLRAEVNECLRWFPDVELSGTSGFHGHQRIFLDVGVGSSGRSYWNSPVTAFCVSRKCRKVFAGMIFNLCVGELSRDFSSNFAS